MAKNIFSTRDTTEFHPPYLDFYMFQKTIGGSCVVFQVQDAAKDDCLAFITYIPTIRGCVRPSGGPLFFFFEHGKKKQKMNKKWDKSMKNE